MGRKSCWDSWEHTLTPGLTESALLWGLSRASLSDAQWPYTPSNKGGTCSCIWKGPCCGASSSSLICT